MSAESRSLRRWLIVLAIAFTLNIAGAHGLDALGLTESLLSPSLARALVAALLGFVFFASRLFLFFIAPGLAIAALAWWFGARERRG
jgi:hypothetical protein